MQRSSDPDAAAGWLNRWRPQSLIPTPFPGFLPALRAYGSFLTPDALGGEKYEPLGRLGTLELRLAQTRKDIKRAQKLRYRVFYKEMNAIADARTKFARRDIDAFDAICDHLLVVDHEPRLQGLRRKPRVVGTYRLLRQEIAEQNSGFYSASEFTVDDLVARHRPLRFLELGRSCVLEPYRNKRTVELLWHGIWSYVLKHRIDAMFGCACLEGTDPDQLKLPLSYLHHFAGAPEAWSARALPHRYVAMDRMPKSAIDMKAALRTLPPLIKGYLRIGARIGEGAVMDRQFGTTDVLIVLPVSAISERYIQHFGQGAERHAA
jgi:putative hemolysin